MELFKLLGTVAVENTEAVKALKETSVEGEKAESKLSKAFDKIGNVAAKTGKAIATGLAAGITAMGTLTLKAMNAAGELEQNMGGSEAVFKESAEKMQETAENAFSNMGLSMSDFLATANKMGALFQGAGFGIEESADMSADAMQRAADVASIMGIDVNSAMEAVAGMAKGNFTMMDNLGVAINDTTLKIYAQEKGLGELETTQDKVNAAYQLFMEKSEYAAGNYRKENETFAGAMTTARAAIDNFLSGSGTAEQLADAFVGAADVIIVKLDEIVPKLTEGIQILIEKLTPKLPEIIERALPGLIQGAVSLLNGLIAASPTIIRILIEQIPFVVSQIASALMQTLPVLLDTAKELVKQLWDYIFLELLNTGISFEYAVGKIQGYCETAFGYIQTGFQTMWNICNTAWATVGKPIFDSIVGAIEYVSDNWGTILEYISGIFGDVWNKCDSAWSTVGKTVFDSIVGAIEYVSGYWEPLQELIFSKFNDIWGECKNIWETTGKLIFDSVVSILKYMGENFSSILKTATDAFNVWCSVKRAVWDNIGKPIFEMASFAVVSLFELFAENMPAIMGFFQEAIAGIKDSWENHLKPVLDAIGAILNDKIKPVFEFVWKTVVESLIVTVFSTIANLWRYTLKPVFDGICDFLLGVFTNDWKLAFNGILEFIAGIFNGIQIAVETPMNAVKTIVGSVIDYIKEKFDFDLEFPKLKLPHFSIEGEFSLIPPSVPEFSIDWYKKAMNEPMIMNSPTAFGINANGQIMAGGEAGSEVVSGTDTLMGMISSAVATQNAELTNVMANIFAFLQEYLPGMSNMQLVMDSGAVIGELAPGMDKELGKIAYRNGRGV